MDDQPKSVKDLLVEAKDASELMVDLAYAAVFFDDEKLAQEVERLEERMNGHLRRLREVAMLAARSPEDAEAMAGVLWIAGAVEKIGDAASDIARVVEARLGIPDALRRDLRHADEMTARVKVEPRHRDRAGAARALAPDRDGHVGHGDPQRDRVAVRPRPDDVLSEGDVLLVRGPEEGVTLLRELAGAPGRPEPPDDDAPPLSELDRAVDILVELKDLSEAAVGLAYSSILFNNRALAAEVGALEAERHPARRAGVLGAPRGRPATPTTYVGCSDSGAPASRCAMPHGTSPGTWSRASRCTRRPDRARGDRGDLRGDRGRSRDPRRRPEPEGAPPRDRDRDVRARGATRAAVDLPSPGTVRAAGGDRLIAVGPEEGAEALDALCRVGRVLRRGPRLRPRPAPARSCAPQIAGGSVENVGEPQMLLPEAELLDLGRALSRQPGEQPIHQAFGCRGTAREPDHVGAFEPRRIDLGLVVDEVGRVEIARDLGQAVGVRRVVRTDDEHDVGAARHLLDRILAVLGRVADVLARRSLDRGNRSRRASTISLVSSTDSVVWVRYDRFSGSAP